MAVCDGRFTEAQLGGDYHIRSRRLGARNRDPRRYARDAEILQAEVDRNPDDARSVFYLAQSYRVRFVPFLLQGVAGDASLNQADGIHPNVRGAEMVADLVWAELEPALRRQNP